MVIGNLCVTANLGSFGEAARIPTAAKWMWVRLEAELPERGGNDGGNLYNPLWGKENVFPMSQSPLLCHLVWRQRKDLDGP